MRRKSKPCVNCNKECFPWKGGLCRFCFLAGAPHKPAKRTRLKPISEKGKEKKKQKQELRKQMFDEFQSFYKNHVTKKCFECGKYISESQFGPMNVHHVLPKARYPEYTLQHWNFLLLCPDDHSMCELDIRSTPKIEERTKELKERFG